MSDHRDPVEAWLSRDVELLPPPPGAFQRVRRQARRRKAVRTMSAAAGAAVIVAAAAVLPQVTGSLLPGPGGPDRAAGGSSAHGQSQRTSPPAPRPSATTRALPNGGPPLASAGSGPSPDPGFQPTSVTFVGKTLGAVIGYAGSSCGGPCAVVAGTHDYGRKWTRIGGPPAGPASGSSGVSQIRFLDRTNGWAYGPALYATHNGGQTWNAVTGLRGRVIDLSTVGSRAFVVAGIGCAGTGPAYARNCAGFSLFSAPATSDHWQPVSGAATRAGVVSGDLQLTSQYGYLIASGLLYAGPVTGGAWHAVPGTSPTTPACLAGSGGSRRWLIAPGTGALLYLACDSPQPGASPAASPALALYLSRDGGKTWQARGPVHAAGTATSLAVSPAGTLVLATTAGIYYSPDGHTWHAAGLDRQAPGGFSFVGMTTSSQGVAVPASSGLHELFITRDGGRTWLRSLIQ